MCLYPIDGNLPPNLHRRQISLCQASGLHLPHANLLADFRLPDQYWEVHQRVSEEILVDFYSLCSNGNKLCGSFLPTTRTPRIEGTEPEAIFVSPVGPYWYLHTLILCALLYYAVFHLVRGEAITRFIILGLCLYGLTCLHLLAYENAAYFLGGCILAQTHVKLNRFFRPSIWAVIPFILLCAVPENLSRGSLAGVIITYLASCLLLYFYPLLTDPFRRNCLYIGQHTLAILLFSPVFTMLAKSYLPLLSFDPTGILFLVTATALAVGGSLAIEQMLYRSGLSRYFFGK